MNFLGFPRYKLFESDGTTLVYQIPGVLNDIGNFYDPSTFVEHTSLRGQGSIVSQGSDEAFDIVLTFLLEDINYEALVAQINALSTTIVKFTKYILKVELTSGGTTKDYKVMRLQSMEFPLDRRKKRVNFQTVILTLRAGTWI